MVDTPGRLRILADRYDAEAGRLEARAKSLRRMAKVSREEADTLQRALPERHHRGTIDDQMVAAARVQISKGKRASKGDPLIEACNRVGLTIRMLAEAVGVSHATISRARTGQRSISAAVAKRIEELTGFAATEKHWPALRGGE